MSTVKIEKGQAFWLADPQEHDFPRSLRLFGTFVYFGRM